MRVCIQPSELIAHAARHTHPLQPARVPPVAAVVFGGKPGRCHPPNDGECAAGGRRALLDGPCAVGTTCWDLPRDGVDGRAFDGAVEARGQSTEIRSHPRLLGVALPGCLQQVSL